MMLRILGAPRRVRVVVAGMFLLSTVLVSIGLAGIAAAAQPNTAIQQGGYTSQLGYGQVGDDDKSKSASPSRTPSKSSSPSKSPSKSPSMSATPSKSESVSPSASATVSRTASAAPTSLPV